MKRLFISMVPIVGLVLMSCFGTGPADYHPFEVGYKWEYKTTTIITTTQYIPDTTTTTDTTTSTQTTEITGTDKLSSGEEVYVTVATINLSDTIMKDTSYMRKDEDSVYTYTSLEDTVPVYTEPAELDVGIEWTHKVTVDTLTYTTTYKAESKEDVTVTAGDYKDCLKISVTQTPQFPNTTATQHQYRAKDVGMVKSEMESKVDTEFILTETHSTIKLQSFTK